MTLWVAALVQLVLVWLALEQQDWARDWQGQEVYVILSAQATAYLTRSLSTNKRHVIHTDRLLILASTKNVMTHTHLLEKQPCHTMIAETREKENPDLSTGTKTAASLAADLA